MSRQPRAIRIEGDVAYVPLTKGYEAVIDAADVPLVGAWSWCASVEACTVYAMRKGPAPDYRTIRLHRYILGAAPGEDVDHQDRNGLNNRRGNLRFASASENARNRAVSRANTSSFKGVSFNVRDKVWQAHIKLDGRKKHLGCFSRPSDAAAAYAKASAALHGEFGRVA